MAVRWAGYLLLWVGFGATHSLLAAAPGRAWLARLAGAGDRLAYNLIALIQLALVLGYAWAWLPAQPFARPEPLRVAQLVALAAGALVLAGGGRGYDLARFVGLAQLRAGPEATAGAEPLVTGGWNARVRHPLYLGLLLLVWGAAWDLRAVATAGCVTAYVLIGIRFEERKLLRLYGPTYAAYRARVPMLLPWRGWR
ncbi:MAG: methyltransferase family protein [Acetobacteraceae bacterium]